MEVIYNLLRTEFDAWLGRECATMDRVSHALNLFGVAMRLPQEVGMWYLTDQEGVTAETIAKCFQSTPARNAAKQRAEALAAWASLTAR